MHQNVDKRPGFFLGKNDITEPAYNFYEERIMKK
jgi:hypothetical protein